MVIKSLWVRGTLGHLQVFCTNGTHKPVRDTPAAWKIHFEAFVPASMDVLRELVLDCAVTLKPGSTCGIYIHSNSIGNPPESIVYNNQRNIITHDDPFLRIVPGSAHTGWEAFSSWGFWGQAWRPNREFVGKVDYGVKWLLWNPEVNRLFPHSFRSVVRVLLLIHRRPGTALTVLPGEALLHILNMCRWDWFADGHPDTVVNESKAEQHLASRFRIIRDRYGSLVRRFHDNIDTESFVSAYSDDEW